MQNAWIRLMSSQRGQGTVEYVLVILAATAIVLVLINWIGGSGTGLFGGLFGSILKKVVGFFR